MPASHGEEDMSPHHIPIAFGKRCGLISYPVRCGSSCLAHTDATAQGVLCFMCTFLRHSASSSPNGTLPHNGGKGRQRLGAGGKGARTRRNHIFRSRNPCRHTRAMQGGRGVLSQKRGENPFSLDPFVLIISRLGFLSPGKIQFLLKIL